MPAIRIKNRQQETIFRYSLLFFIGLLIAHYISYQKLPFWDEDYRFPLRAYIIVIVFGLLICETNTLIYRRLNKWKPFPENITRRVVLQYGLTLTSTLVLFSLLYVLINMLIFKQPFHFFRYSFYLGLCLFLSAFEATIYTAKELLYLFRSQNKILQDNLIAQNRTFSFRVHNKTFTLPYGEIAYISSAGGIVVLCDRRNKRYITHFASFNALPALPSLRFFRINRQMIINRDVVKSFEVLANRSIRLYLVRGLMEGLDEILISRYKSAEFKRWYRQGTSGSSMFEA